MLLKHDVRLDVLKEKVSYNLVVKHQIGFQFYFYSN